MSGTSLCCHGSRRLVYVNMVVFSEEDCILIKNLYELKGCGAKRLIKEFPTKGWKLRVLNKLLRKLKDTGTTDRRPRSGRPRSVRTASNIRWQRVTVHIHLPHTMLLCAIQQSIDISCLLGHISKVFCCGPCWERQMEGHMPYRCSDPSPHTVRAVPIRFSISVHYTW